MMVFLRKLFYCADVAMSALFVISLPGRCFAIANLTHQINEEINDKEIRLIGEEGEQLGIMSAAAAL